MASVSSDVPVSDDCLTDCGVGADDRLRIIFHPDYIDYGGNHYLDSVVNFTEGLVEAKSKSSGGDERFLHILMEINDIVKIESQWSARFGAGIISIYFISKCARKEGRFVKDSVSGIEELKFPSLDANWYEKYEAIESLNVRYKALWNVLLDTGLEKPLPLAEREAMLHPRSYFPNFDKPFDEIIYPEGDPDAVSLSKRDIDLLLPDTFVNDTIVDFYIKYLKSKLTTTQKTKFHFFNSFFFRKLADMDKDPSSAFDGKAAFQRVRKWTRKVNLLDKDFIFIPVNYSLHWSLIVICYFGESAVSKDAVNDKITPCILHMDSIKGTHKDLKDLMQSYLWEEWKERQKETCEDMSSKFRNLKFVSLELPQQQNASDCGMFVLHYVERFLEELPPFFNIHNVTSSSKFLQADWFPPCEASLKRTRIERLIKVILDNQSKDSSPLDGRGIGCFPDISKSDLDQHNNLEYLGKSSIPLRNSGKTSVCPVGEEVDVAQRPTSSGRKTSESNLKEFFDQGTCTATWMSSMASLDEFEKPVSQEHMEASACYTKTVLTEPNFQRLDGVDDQAHLFQYSSGDFGLESTTDHIQPRLDDVDSSSVPNSVDDVLEVAENIVFSSSPPSGKLNIGAEESRDEISCRNAEKNLQGIKNERGDELPANCAPSSSTYDCFTDYADFISGTNLDCGGEQEYQMVSSNDDQVHDDTLAEDSHAAKRMRFSAPDVESQLTMN